MSAATPELRNVIPSLAIHNVAYRLINDAIGKANGSLGNTFGMQGSDLFNALACQFRVWVTIAKNMASFLNGILPVVVIGAKKKVLRIDAITNITAMENLKAIRNGAVMDFKGESVGHCFSPINVQKTVSIACFRCRPYPTRSRFLNGIKKTLRWIFECGHRRAFPGAKSTFPVSVIDKYCSADWTDSCGLFMVGLHRDLVNGFHGATSPEATTSRASLIMAPL